MTPAREPWYSAGLRLAGARFRRLTQSGSQFLWFIGSPEHRR